MQKYEEGTRKKHVTVAPNGGLIEYVDIAKDRYGNTGQITGMKNRPNSLKIETSAEKVTGLKDAVKQQQKHNGYMERIRKIKRKGAMWKGSIAGVQTGSKVTGSSGGGKKKVTAKKVTSKRVKIQKPGKKA